MSFSTAEVVSRRSDSSLVCPGRIVRGGGWAAGAGQAGKSKKKSGEKILKIAVDYRGAVGGY